MVFTLLIWDNYSKKFLRKEVHIDIIHRVPTCSLTMCQNILKPASKFKITMRSV